MSNHDFLTEKEVEPILRVRLKTLQQWRTLKKGPRFVRVGSRVFYPRAEIERFISENLVETDDTRRDAR
jgi:hypothetical protein